MKQLLYTIPDLELPDEVAIVGSSGILKGSGYGELIDSFEYVVRFNRAPTEGFEQDVGSQTNMHVVNGHVFTNQKIKGSGWGKEHEVTQPQFFIRDSLNANIYCIGNNLPPYSKIYEYTNKSNKVFYFQYGQIGEIKHNFGFKSDLSVGACFIVICYLSGIDIHLFGIDVEDRRRDHYWETRPEAGPCHDIPNEKKILKKLISTGLVKIYV